mgnify:CR=1 FL=1
MSSLSARRAEGEVVSQRAACHLRKLCQAGSVPSEMVPETLVKWAAWRGLYLDKIRNETGVTVLHNAMVK